jgi:hypothetical protein
MLNAIGGGSPVKISGKTEDGKLVLSGVFRIVSSLTGLPLEIVLDQLDKKGMVVNWLDYFYDSVDSGMKPERVIERIRNAVGDVHGTDVGNEVIQRLKYCINMPT